MWSAVILRRYNKFQSGISISLSMGDSYTLLSKFFVKSKMFKLNVVKKRKCTNLQDYQNAPLP